MTRPEVETPTERVRRFYQRYAPRYDHETGYYDRLLLGDGRSGGPRPSAAIRHPTEVVSRPATIRKPA